MSLESLIASVPDGYSWLLRNDDEKGYFAHVYIDDPWQNFPVSSTSYKETPEAALADALARISR